MTRDTKNVIVGLDVGTSKVVVVVAEVMPDGRLEVLGVGQNESKGMRKGVVVNAAATVDSIRKAVGAAEKMSDFRVRNVFASLAGNHVRSFNSRGMVPIKEREVTSSDVEKVIETARAVIIQNDQTLLHAVPQKFFVDSQADVREPTGMAGVRLEVEVHIVTCSDAAVKNILSCAHRCNLEVPELILQPMASAEGILTADEKELGVVLIDIGGGTTDIAVFVEGVLRHTAVIQIAGDQITSDIAIALRTPRVEAEKLKIQYGVARHELANPLETLEVPGAGDRAPRTLSRQALASIIEPRIDELFGIVRNLVKESGYEGVLSSGVVITGGAALMPGMLELAEQVFNTSARLGRPDYRGAHSEIVCNPRYSTVMGLLAAARDKSLKRRQIEGNEGPVKAGWQHIKAWFMANF
jgi:cell division protein FtsA